MRLIQLEEYNPDTMQLAKPVYDAKGRILLAAGNTIHPKYLSKLIEIGISFLIIEDCESQGITLDDMVDMPTWMDAINVIKESFENVAKKQAVPLRSLQKIVAKLLNEIKSRKIVMLIPSTAIAQDLRQYAHAVNVALLSLQIGKYLRYNDFHLRDLGIGCLLHDIGKAQTDDEKKHPEMGFNVIRDIREINLMAAHIAYQHHEKINGEGYPRGMKGSAVLDFAQICSVANLYENLTSLKKMPPYEAMEIIMARNEIDFRHTVIEAFFKGVPSYLPGMMVKLNTNDTAIVTRIESHIHRPVVRVHSTGKECSLEDHPTMMITEQQVSEDIINSYKG